VENCSTSPKKAAKLHNSITRSDSEPIDNRKYANFAANVFYFHANLSILFRTFRNQSIRIGLLFPFKCNFPFFSPNIRRTNSNNPEKLLELEIYRLKERQAKSYHKIFIKKSINLYFSCVLMVFLLRSPQKLSTFPAVFNPSANLHCISEQINMFNAFLFRLAGAQIFRAFNTFFSYSANFLLPLAEKELSFNEIY
jgi:hypothetical protein